MRLNNYNEYTDTDENEETDVSLKDYLLDRLAAVGAYYGVDMITTPNSNYTLATITTSGLKVTLVREMFSLKLLFTLCGTKTYQNATIEFFNNGNCVIWLSATTKTALKQIRTAVSVSGIMDTHIGVSAAFRAAETKIEYLKIIARDDILTLEESLWDIKPQYRDIIAAYCCRMTLRRRGAFSNKEKAIQWLRQIGVIPIIVHYYWYVGYVGVDEGRPRYNVRHTLNRQSFSR